MGINWQRAINQSPARRNSQPMSVFQYGVRRHCQSAALPIALALLCAACGWVFAAAGLFTAPAGAAISPSWSGPVEIDQGRALSAISCPSLGLCVAVDDTGHAILSTRPTTGGAGTWSAPFALAGAEGLTSISCASTTLCVAVDGAGHAFLSTQPALAGPGSWSAPFTIDGSEALSSVSCASAALCAAVDGEGHVIFSTHPGIAGSGSWSAPSAIGGVGALTSVSCASTALCVAVDGAGHVAVSSEPAAGVSTWHTRLIDPNLGLAAVSCFAADSCVAVDGAGVAFASANVPAAIGAGAGQGSGATWSSTAFDLFGAPTALSCAATGVCVAVDGTGYAFAGENPTMAPPGWLASGIDTQPARTLRGVSCVSEGPGLCAAVDASGRVFTAELPAPAVVSPPSEVGLVQPHPSIAGTPAPGQALTCRSGVSVSGVTLGYTWLRDTRTIAGAAGPVYLVGSGDVSHHLQCRVSATTAAGSLSATSAFVTVPAGGVGAISETLVGAPRVGRAAVRVPLTCSAQAAGRCTIKLRLTVLETLSGSRIVALAAQRSKRVTVTVGASSVRLKPGQRSAATVALNATGRRLLAHVRRLAVRLSVSGTVVGAISASLKSATITFTGSAKASAGNGARSLLPAGHPAVRSPGHAGAADHSSGQATPAGRSLHRHAASKAGGASPASALAPTPYMGWDTYFTFGGHFDEAAVLEQASLLLTSGLASKGYRYVWLDAGWWQGARDATGAIAVNPVQWPHGMAWLASTLHATGLKVGLYTDAGSVGCGGPGQGSYGHYQQDVNTFTAWGFDAVKVDFCGGVRQGLQPAAAYAAFHEAIVHNSSRRPLLLSICNFLQPGQFAPENPSPENSAFASYTFGPSSGSSWRTNTDLGVPGDVRFGSVLTNLDADAAQPQAAGPGHWNDPDYLGPDQGMNAAQFRTQFSMWVMLAAPLMISGDLITLSPASAATVANREAIAIDQDPAGLQARLLATSGEAQVWVKALSDGSRAVTLLNRGSQPLRIATSAAAVGMPAANSYALRNIWSGALSSLRPPVAIAANVPANSTVLLRVFAR
jgi:hypothetical protein